MKKFAVIGLGVFGSSIAKSLTEKGVEVIAIDRDMERVNAIQDYVTLAVRLDSTDESALMAQGVNEVDVAIVCIGEHFEDNLLTSVLLKQLGVKTVITRATSDIQTKILNAVGIDRIINPEQEVGEKLAYTLVHPSLNEIFYLSGSVTIAEIKVPERFVGKTPGELQLRAKYGINLILIERKVEEALIGEKKVLRHKTIIPAADTVLEADDDLVVVGTRNGIKKLAES